MQSQENAVKIARLGDGRVWGINEEWVKWFNLPTISCIGCMITLLCFENKCEELKGGRIIPLKCVKYFKKIRKQWKTQSILSELFSIFRWFSNSNYLILDTPDIGENFQNSYRFANNATFCPADCKGGLSVLRKLIKFSKTLERG